MMLYQDYIPQKELVAEQGLDKEVAGEEVTVQGWVVVGQG